MTFMTTPEVSQLLRVSPRTIKRLMKKKQIPYLKIGGSVRFDRNRIEEFLREKSVV